MEVKKKVEVREGKKEVMGEEGERKVRKSKRR